LTERLRVWITRAEPGASATADRVRLLGLEPMVAPVLTVQPLADAPLELNGVTALAVTSTNGLWAFARREARRDLPVFAVGDATAKAARAAGFADVTSADGEMVALVRLLADVRPDGVILHPCGRHLAGDLVGGLKRVGLRSRDAPLYDTPALEALTPELERAFREREVAAVLVHSPRGGSIVAELAADFDHSDTVAAGLSSACLRPLRALGFAGLAAAKTPREDALLDALALALGISRGRR
jgi:uroporphyrinogen-III synthase